MEAPAVMELLVFEELRLDTVLSMVAEFAPYAIVAEHELEQDLARPRLPRGPANVIEQQILLSRQETIHRGNDKAGPTDGALRGSFLRPASRRPPRGCETRGSPPYSGEVGGSEMLMKLAGMGERRIRTGAIAQDRIGR
jgi:hypothetical protein